MKKTHYIVIICFYFSIVYIANDGKELLEDPLYVTEIEAYLNKGRIILTDAACCSIRKSALEFNYETLYDRVLVDHLVSSIRTEPFRIPAKYETPITYKVELEEVVCC